MDFLNPAPDPHGPTALGDVTPLLFVDALMQCPQDGDVNWRWLIFLASAIE